MRTKSWLRSKTLWTNLAAAIGWLAASDLIASDPRLVAALGIAHAIVNFVLRFATVEPIGMAPRR